MTASLRVQSSKADSNTCESFTRSGLKLESVHQESPRSDVFRKRATKPLLNQRGRRDGVRRKVRARGNKLPLPTVVLANTRSLSKQLPELQSALRCFTEYRDSCLLCFTETLLKDTIDNSLLRVAGFSDPVRTDRDPQVTGKKVGGGVCIHINERWCKNYTLRESYCSEDIELLSSSFRPFYIYILHLHLVIWQMLLSKATYNWGIHKAIHLEEAVRQRKCS